MAARIHGMAWTIQSCVILTLSVFLSDSTRLYRESYELSNGSALVDPGSVNDINSEFGELVDSDITSLLNYTLHSVQNSSQFHEQAKKHAIVLTHRNPHWIEQVAKKLAPLFSAISLWNEKCWTAGYDQGTCYSRKECIQKGGTPNGFCAGGFGVCCSFSYACDSVTYFNRTYFMNAEFPYSSHEFGTCFHTAAKLADICQIRLDFEIFELERPESTGVCLHDKFHIDGIDFKMPPLCGDLTGHHLYLPVGFDSEIKMTMVLSPGSYYRRWKIKTTRMRCNTVMLAPGGCAQYHHGTFGRITSFNYVDGMESNMNKLDYGVCVRKEKGFCAVQWSVCGYEKKRRKRNTDDGEVDERLVPANQGRMSKRLWETGYDSQTEQERICRELARNSTALRRQLFNNSTNSPTFVQRISCPNNQIKTYYSTVSDSSWRPFIPPANYFHHQKKETQQQEQQKPQNQTSNSSGSNAETKSNQKIESKLGTADVQLLVQSGNEYHRNEVNGPVKLMKPVASHVYEHAQYPHPKITYAFHQPQSFYQQQQQPHPHVNPNQQTNSVVNHAYGPSLRRPIISVHPVSQNTVQLKEAIVKVPEKKKVFKKPVKISPGAILTPQQPTYVKKKHVISTIAGGIKEAIGNKIVAIQKPSFSDIKDSVADKLNSLHKPAFDGAAIHTAIADKLNSLPKPTFDGGAIHAVIADKINAHAKPLPSLVGDHGIIGKFPVFAKPVGSLSGIKGSLLDKVHAKPKPPVSQASLLIPGKIPEKPKLPVSGAALLKPGKIKENAKLPPKAVAAALLKPGKIKENAKLPPKAVAAALLKPGKIVAKPKLPIKGSGFGLLGRPKVKPKLKPKYPIKLKKPGVKPKPKPKPKPGQCQNKTKLVLVPVPIPLPIPIPIPIVPVVVVPFPFGGGGGEGGIGGHGWESDGHVISVTEPYMIRVVTDKKRDDGLSSFCMDWEQISCDEWHHHPEYLKHEEEEHEYDDDDNNYNYEEDGDEDNRHTNEDYNHNYDVMDY